MKNEDHCDMEMRDINFRSEKVTVDVKVPFHIETGKPWVATFIIPFRMKKLRSEKKMKKYSCENCIITRTSSEGMYTFSCHQENRFTLDMKIPEDFNFSTEGNMDRVICTQLNTADTSTVTPATADTTTDTITDDDDVEIQYMKYWSEDPCQDMGERCSVARLADHSRYCNHMCGSTREDFMNYHADTSTCILPSKFYVCRCSNDMCSFRLYHNHGWGVGVWGDCLGECDDGDSSTEPDPEPVPKKAKKITSPRKIQPPRKAKMTSK
jgi:hypothetical protein